MFETSELHYGSHANGKQQHCDTTKADLESAADRCLQRATTTNTLDTKLIKKGRYCVGDPCASGRAGSRNNDANSVAQTHDKAAASVAMPIGPLLVQRPTHFPTQAARPLPRKAIAHATDNRPVVGVLREATNAIVARHRTSPIVQDSAPPCVRAGTTCALEYLALCAGARLCLITAPCAGESQEPKHMTFDAWLRFRPAYLAGPPNTTDESNHPGCGGCSANPRQERAGKYHRRALATLGIPSLPEGAQVKREGGKCAKKGGFEMHKADRRTMPRAP